MLKKLIAMFKREYGEVKDYDYVHLLYGFFSSITYFLVDKLYSVLMVCLFVLYQILDYKESLDRPSRDVVTFITGFVSIPLLLILYKLLLYISLIFR